MYSLLNSHCDVCGTKSIQKYSAYDCQVSVCLTCNLIIHPINLTGTSSYKAKEFIKFTSAKLADTYYKGSQTHLQLDAFKTCRAHNFDNTRDDLAYSVAYIAALAVIKMSKDRARREKEKNDLRYKVKHKGTLKVYTDASLKSNDAGIAYIIVENGAKIAHKGCEKVSFKDYRYSVGELEMMAVRKGLEKIVKEYPNYYNQPIEVYTDCAFNIGNLEKVYVGSNISFQYVKAHQIRCSMHSHGYFNNIADELAKKARES